MRLLLLWFCWLQAWNIVLPSLVVTQRPTGGQITRVTTAMAPKIEPIRHWLELSLSSLRMQLQNPTIEPRNKLRPGVDSGITFRCLFESSRAHGARINFTTTPVTTGDTYADSLAQQRTRIATTHTGS